MVSLAVNYENGFLACCAKMKMKKNPHKAMMFYKRAAAANSSFAQDRLCSFFSGDSSIVGVVKNKGEALKWCKSAAASGERRAQLLLGEIFWKGDGVTRDYRKAFLLFQKAAVSVENAPLYPDAKGWLAEAYLYGKGVPKDIKKGMQLMVELVDSESYDWPANLDVLAENGDELAQFFLGMHWKKLYQTGHDPQDLEQAKKWFTKSAIRFGRSYRSSQNVQRRVIFTKRGRSLY